MNEHQQKHVTKVEGSSDRAFGLVFAVVFILVALFPLVSGRPIRVWAIPVSGVFLALALVAPRILAPANRLWTRFGDLLHRIVSPIALGVLFFGVISPTGLVMRALGKDPLRLRIDRSASSYWISRTPPGPEPESLKNQF